MEKPEIRFKGYTDEWEQRKVTDLGEIYIGLVTTMTEHYTDKGHLLIRNSDIKDGYFEFGENPIHLDEEFSEQNKSRMHQLGDVITVHTGDIGTSAVIGENEVNSIGFATIVTRPNQEILDSNYFATYLNTDTHKQWAVSMATGDGRSNYNLKDYTKLIVPIPEIEEQKKIAACIVNLNTLITLHQRKCDEVKSLKKYMLQKMFPQNEQKVPEIRFEGFTEAWEQRKVGEFLTESRESGHKGDVAHKMTVKLWGKGVYEKNDAGSVNTQYFTRHAGQFIYSKLDFLNCAFGVVPEELESLETTADVPAFDCDGVNPHFMFYTAIQPSFYEKNGMIADGSRKAKRIHVDTFLDMPFIVPSLEEQNKIVNLLSGLDDLLTLHQQKCEELKKIKKFMLQKMFV